MNLLMCCRYKNSFVFEIAVPLDLSYGLPSTSSSSSTKKTQQFYSDGPSLSYSFLAKSAADCCAASTLDGGAFAHRAFIYSTLMA